jgi:hypothetical protein
MKIVWIRIRDAKMFGSGSGIKHFGSATLSVWYYVLVPIPGSVAFIRNSPMPVYYTVDNILTVWKLRA